MKTLRLIKLMAILLIIIQGILLLFISGTLRMNHKEEPLSLYAKEATITTIDIVRKRVGATDSKGYEWYWYYGESPIECNLDDQVLLIIDDNKTEYVFDDEVISITNKDWRR